MIIAKQVLEHPLDSLVKEDSARQGFNAG